MNTKIQTVTRTLVVLAVPLIAALGLASPSAASGVSVTLEVAAVNHHAAATSCVLSVPSGASGETVLDAAVATGCISSYETREFPGFGTFVRCINGVCQLTDGVDPGTDGLVTYWEMRENGAFTDYGVDGFRAAAGDVLTFTYTNFATFLVP